ncbi:MAG: YitT family protein [Clostridiales bacterium]|nr:YitT family protein [Clostridiales bacterium]MDY3747656.1 YitT family protein [Lachnospiraceae bacterium]
MRNLSVKQKKIKDLFLDVCGDIIGSFIFGIGIISFIGPANIAPGGVSSIALMINHFIPVPIGLTSFLINVPLLILSFLYLGKRFTFKTIRTLAINTVVIDLIVTPLIPIYSGDRLLGSLYGGVLVGAGLALIFLRGSTTGGTDIVSFLLQKFVPSFSIGRAMMIIDGSVIAASMLVYRDIESGLFGIISLFTMTQVLDGIIYGVDKGCLVTVISPKNRQIAERIISEMDRGATFLKGEGGYSHEEKDVLLCAVRQVQFTRLKSIIYQEDRDAFIIVSDVGQILGEGFKKEVKS